MSIHDDIYPYDRGGDDDHPYAYVFVNAGGVRHDRDTCNALARHVFDYLGAAPPGTAHPPTIKYDALGGSGAPWEFGRWIKWEDDRVKVTATAAPRDVTEMTWAERAELRAALEAAEIAEQAGATHRVEKRNSD